MGSAATVNADFRKLGFCFFGVFFCYLFFGFAQEKITRGDYDGEKFTYAQALVFVQCVFSLVFAYIMIKTTKAKEDKTPVLLYASCSFCYTGAMVASNTALSYISYPAQVIGKACKPIPVMILGVILAKKVYPLIKYLCIVMIVSGVAMFLYKDSKATSGTAFELGAGELLLLVSLTLDGLTGVTQEKMRGVHSTGQYHMMFNVNLYSCFILFGVMVYNGQGLEFVDFCWRHPKVLKFLLAFCLTSAFGQLFIFLTVVTFGPLTCSVITTTRKFFTILCSVIIFGNPMSSRQWLAVVLVFIGLALDAKYGKSKKEKTTSKKEKLAQ